MTNGEIIGLVGMLLLVRALFVERKENEKLCHNRRRKNT